MFRGLVPFFVDHGSPAPRGADDPPAAHLFCCQEVVQRDPQLHVTASCNPLNLSTTFTQNLPQVYSGGECQLQNIEEGHQVSDPEKQNS